MVMFLSPDFNWLTVVEDLRYSGGSFLRWGA